LAQTRDYIQIHIKNEETFGNKIDESNTPQHILDYLNEPINTVLPDFINQKHILVFDQNFECGNLDSAYIHNCEEYNLLMKVDTNTKGNTSWFYFQVQNFRVGVKYTFSIYNFTRSIEKFYKEGMNIVTQAVKTDKPKPKPFEDQAKVDNKMEEMEKD
jgi:hypothetical protein